MALSAVDCVTDNRCFYNLKIKNKYYEANKANTIQDVLPSCGALIHKMLNGKKQLTRIGAKLISHVGCSAKLEFQEGSHSYLRQSR